MDACGAAKTLFWKVLIKRLLDKDLKVNIDTIDERLSSISAKKIMIQLGIKTGHNKGKIDQLSAAIIIQEYLDSQ